MFPKKTHIMPFENKYLNDKIKNVNKTVMCNYIKYETHSNLWQAEYYPFGKIYSSSGEIENNLRFPGQYQDISILNYYNGFRWYSPKIGSYFQYDPFPDLKDIFSNYYYVNSNPVNIFDFFGLYYFDYESCKCLPYFPIIGPSNTACNFFVPIIREKFPIRGDCMNKACKEVTIRCKKDCIWGDQQIAGVPRSANPIKINIGCAYGECPIVLCKRFQGLSLKEKSCAIIHELAHWCGATEMGAYALQYMICPAFGGGETIEVHP